MEKRVLKNRSIWACAAIIVTGLTISAGSAASSKPQQSLVTNPNALWIRSSELQLGPLLLMSSQELEGCDIALFNLLCASGLPGAEGLDGNIENYRGTLDAWADHVRTETERNLHLFTNHPQEYNNSLAYFKALVMASVLQEDLHVHYDPACIKDRHFPYTNSKQLFIHGLIGEDHSGTCASLPVLYVAIGRRLGYPLYLVSTRGHFFVRWESKDKSDRFNLEATSRGLAVHDDEFYKHWPAKLTDAEQALYLKNLTSAEELALFLVIRGDCLEALNRHPEARVAYAHAHALVPRSQLYLDELAHSLSLPTPGLATRVLEPIPTKIDLNPELPDLPQLNVKRTPP
jgi:hypothetical protein